MIMWGTRDWLPEPGAWREFEGWSKVKTGMVMMEKEWKSIFWA